MKRIALLSIMLAMTSVFFSCSKNEYEKDKDNNNTPPADPNAMKYTLNGISDHTMQWTDTLMMPLAVTHTAGNQEKLSLSVSGLPTGATATFDVPSGIPSFASIMTLRTNSVAGGSYNLKITGTTAKDSVKTFEMKLTVNGEPAPCAKAATYKNVQNLPSMNETKQFDTYAETTPTKNRLLLKNCLYTDYFSGTGQYEYFDLETDLNCDDNTLIVRRKDIPNNQPYYVEGEGTFTENTMDIKLYLKPTPTVVVRQYHLVLTRK